MWGSGRKILPRSERGCARVAALARSIHPMKNPLPTVSSALVALVRPTRKPLVCLTFAVSAVTTFRANMTLTKTFLDSVNGFVNFAKPTLGSGANAIPNTLQPGDTVFLEGH